MVWGVVGADGPEDDVSQSEEGEGIAEVEEDDGCVFTSYAELFVCGGEE